MTGQKATSVSVIIPFFQRESGILPKAVRSALAQEGFDDFEIIVVDDASPVPAADELAELRARHPDRIRIIKRPNGGPGAARNTALDGLPRDRAFVAFLDSDDEWKPHHLAEAIAVLEHDGGTAHDFFFANLFDIGRDTNRYDREREVGFKTRLRDEEMRPIDGLDQCFAFTGDMFDRVLFSGNLMMPSTVVYRFAKYPDDRFYEEYRNMGEDYLFFAGIAHQGARFAFSWRPVVVAGRGVNLFYGSGWGTPRFLSRLCDEMTFRKFAAGNWPLNAEQKRVTRDKLNKARRNFALAFLGYLRRGDVAQFRQLFRFIGLDPAFALLYPLHLVAALFAPKEDA